MSASRRKRPNSRGTAICRDGPGTDSCAATNSGHRNSLSVVQLVEQRLRLLQAKRIKSFGEPAVDRGEKITGFAVPVLFEPEARQADRCPEFKELCALELRYRDCLVIAPLGRGWIARGIQQIASHPVQVSLGAPFAGRLDDPRS